jgi:hypothetical protein
MASNPFAMALRLQGGKRNVQTRQLVVSITPQLLVDFSPPMVVMVVKNAGSVNILCGNKGSDLLNNGAIFAPGDVLNIYSPLELYAVTASSTALCSILTVLSD